MRNSSKDKELLLLREVPRDILLYFLGKDGNLLPTSKEVSSFLHSSPSRLFKP